MTRGRVVRSVLKLSDCLIHDKMLCKALLELCKASERLGVAFYVTGTALQNAVSISRDTDDAACEIEELTVVYFCSDDLSLRQDSAYRCKLQNALLGLVTNVKVKNIAKGYDLSRPVNVGASFELALAKSGLEHKVAVRMVKESGKYGINVVAPFGCQSILKHKKFAFTWRDIIHNLTDVIVTKWFADLFS